MAIQRESDWDTVEGGFPTDFIGQIEQSFWEQGDFGTQLNLVITVEQVFAPAGSEQSERKAWYSAGKDWEVSRGGQRVEHTSRDPKARFRSNSKVGLLLKRVAVEMGLPVAEWGSSKDASVWKGRRFHFREERMPEMVIKGETMEPTIILPIELVGAKGSRLAQAARTAGAAARSQPAAAVAEELPIDQFCIEVLDKWQNQRQINRRCVQHTELSANSDFMSQLSEGLLDELVASGRVIQEGDLYIGKEYAEEGNGE